MAADEERQEPKQVNNSTVSLSSRHSLRARVYA